MYWNIKSCRNWWTFGEIFKRWCKYSLTKAIAEIHNTSIFWEIFKSDCKIAKLKPLHNKGSRINTENFRHISLLPLILKVIEKILYNQVDHFLFQNNILYNYQSRFWKNHSTNFCLSFLNDKILKSFDKGLYTGMIIIDLQKIFNTINYENLCNLHAIDFSEKTIAWFKTYLWDRAFKLT